MDIYLQGMRDRSAGSGTESREAFGSNTVGESVKKRFIDWKVWPIPIPRNSMQDCFFFFYNSVAGLTNQIKHPLRFVLVSPRSIL